MQLHIEEFLQIAYIHRHTQHCNGADLSGLLIIPYKHRFVMDTGVSLGGMGGNDGFGPVVYVERHGLGLLAAVRGDLIGQIHIDLYDLLVFRLGNIDACGNDLIQGHTLDLKLRRNDVLLHHCKGEGILLSGSHDAVLHLGQIAVPVYADIVGAGRCLEGHDAPAVCHILGLGIGAEVHVYANVGSCLAVSGLDLNGDSPQQLTLHYLNGTGQNADQSELIGTGQFHLVHAGFLVSMLKLCSFRRSRLFHCAVPVFDHQSVEQSLILTAAGVKHICNALLHSSVTVQCRNRLGMYGYRTADTGGGVPVVVDGNNFICIGSGSAQILIGKCIAAVSVLFHCTGCDQIIAAGADLPEDPIAAGLLGFIRRPLDGIGSFRLLHSHFGHRSHCIVDLVCGICILAHIAAPVRGLGTDINGGTIHHQQVGDLHRCKQIVVRQICEALEGLIGFCVRICLILHCQTGQQQVVRCQNADGMVIQAQLPVSGLMLWISGAVVSSCRVAVTTLEGSLSLPAMSTAVT